MPNVQNMKDSFVSTSEMRCGQSGAQTYAKFHPQANFYRMHTPWEKGVCTENADTTFM